MYVLQSLLLFQILPCFMTEPFQEPKEFLLSINPFPVSVLCATDTRAR